MANKDLRTYYVITIAPILLFPIFMGIEIEASNTIQKKLEPKEIIISAGANTLLVIVIVRLLYHEGKNFTI